MRFFGQQIDVTVAGELHQPASFRLGDALHVIKEVLQFWPAYSFPNDGRRHRWWQRRHRNYYMVRTDNDDVFEIYFDRGISPKHEKYRKWYVTQQL